MKQQDALTGIWVDAQGMAHLAWRSPDGSSRQETVPFQAFAWARSDAPDPVDAVSVSLEGNGEFDRLLTFSDAEAYAEFVKAQGRSNAIDWIRNLESQFLLSQRQRLFRDLRFSALRRLQLDIETACSVEGSFSSPSRKEDRVLAIGLQCGDRVETLVLGERKDASERELLKLLGKRIQEIDPDVIEGHNIFKFDLDYLQRRAKRFKLSLDWGRFGQEPSFRKTRLKVAERWIDYTRCDIPGRAVVDTYLLVQLYDIRARELMAYGLKDVAKYLGVTPEDGVGRTYIAGDRIQYLFDEDRETFLAYLRDDLRETKGVADQLLPTYFEQAKAFPITLQEACLRGTSAKVDLVFYEEYYHARQSCPMPTEAAAFEGAYAASFEEGVFKEVLHFDVASLYPSLLLLIGRNPERDSLGVFIPMLKRLREYRLKYKQLARTAADRDLAREYDARQSSFKILINSFYGYLGFSGARFGDAALAAEVTSRGREVLKTLIDHFAEKGCKPLEADTDGIYVLAGDYYRNPEALLAEAQARLPEGIELEFDGRYEAMFCYKAKNYALFDGERVTVRGSALRSRGIEPFLRELTHALIHGLLGASPQDAVAMARDYEKRIASQSFPVDRLAKSEILSSAPDAYRKKIEAGGKPRRAALEVALISDKPASLGDRVSYFIARSDKGQSADWQRARPVEAYDPERLPYDPNYYLKKLEEWKTRYAAFLPGLLDTPEQGWLF